MADTFESMGPVGYLVVEFPGNKMTGEGFPLLVDLVERGVIRILDLVFILKAPDGSIAAIEMSDLDRDDDMDITLFEGASSGLFDEDDIADAGSVIEPGSSAGVLIYENRWAAPFVDALRRGGAEVVSAGFIPLDVVGRVARRERIEPRLSR